MATTSYLRSTAAVSVNPFVLNAKKQSTAVTDRAVHNYVHYFFFKTDVWHNCHYIILKMSAKRQSRTRQHGQADKKTPFRYRQSVWNPPQAT